jgi:hypothetical protein
LGEKEEEEREERRDRRVNLSVYLISRERNLPLLYLSTDPISHDRVLPQDCGEPYSHAGKDGAGLSWPTAKRG